MLLSPHDWLLLTESTWKKLQTPEEIDAYVERRTVGPLFVFDQIERRDDRQVIIGSLYNSSRTEKVVIELSLQQGLSQPGPKNPNEANKKKKAKETNIPSMVNINGKQQVPIHHGHGMPVPIPDNDDDGDDDE